MFKFLESIFGGGAQAGAFPESLVKAAIERAIDGTDPWIRAVSGYQEKMNPAVVKAIEYVVSLIDGMASPIDLSIENFDDNPQLRTLFISRTDFVNFLGSDKNLVKFNKQNEMPPLAFALLVIEKQEKIISGTDISGDIILRDVPMVAVSFDAPRLIELSFTEVETRRQLKRRSYDHLLSLALRRITTVKTVREKLERYRTLLQSKLSLLQRGEWGFHAFDKDEPVDAASMEKELNKIEADLQELGGDDNMLTTYLDVLTNVLSRPEEHLWLRKETLTLDRMGIKRDEVTDSAKKVSLEVICNDEGRSLVVTLVSLKAGA